MVSSPPRDSNGEEKPWNEPTSVYMPHIRRPAQEKPQFKLLHKLVTVEACELLACVEATSSVL